MCRGKYVLVDRISVATKTAVQARLLILSWRGLLILLVRNQVAGFSRRRSLTRRMKTSAKKAASSA